MVRQMADWKSYQKELEAAKPSPARQNTSDDLGGDNPFNFLVKVEEDAQATYAQKSVPPCIRSIAFMHCLLCNFNEYHKQISIRMCVSQWEIQRPLQLPGT